MCSQCRSRSQGFDFARAYGPYEGNLRQVIQKLKFEGFQRLAYPLAGLLKTCYQQSGLDLQLRWIVPVPSHRKRIRERGFDQTRLLGRLFSRQLGIPLFQGLRRVRNTVPLFGLTLRERQRNIAGAFDFRDAHLLANHNLLLIDDVMTTGTTVGEISRLLRQRSEAKMMVVLTLARVPRFDDRG